MQQQVRCMRMPSVLSWSDTITQPHADTITCTYMYLWFWVSGCQEKVFKPPWNLCFISDLGSSKRLKILCFGRFFYNDLVWRMYGCMCFFRGFYQKGPGKGGVDLKASGCVESELWALSFVIACPSCYVIHATSAWFFWYSMEFLCALPSRCKATKVIVWQILTQTSLQPSLWLG